MFLKHYFESGGPDSFSIPRLREKINNYYTIRNRARNVRTLMETIGQDELKAEMGIGPRLDQSIPRHQIPANVYSEMASFLSGIPRRTYQMQQKALREQISRIPRAPGVGGYKKIRKTLRRKKSLRKTRRFR
jgi:hypothetical protein